jgi:WD40 repeat protein
LVSGGGTFDNDIKVWDIQSGHCIQTLRGHQDSVYSLESLPSGELVSADYKGVVKIWDLSSGRCLDTVKAHAGPVNSLKRVSIPGEDGGSQWASCSDDGKIKIWHLINGRGRCLKTLEGHKSEVYSIQFLSPDKLVSCSSDEGIKFWDLLTGECVNTWKSQGISTAIELLPNGYLVSNAITGRKYAIKIWNLKTGTSVIEVVLEDSIARFKSLSNGKLVCGFQGGTALQVLDLRPITHALEAKESFQNTVKKCSVM